MAIKSMEYVEIRTRNIGQAQTYYKNVLDWHIAPMPGPSDGTMLMVDTGVFPYGALMEFTQPEIPLGVVAYLTVEDCAETARTAQKLGATVIIECQEVEGMGWFSQIVDPWGNQIAFWHDKKREDPASFKFQGPGTNFNWLEFIAPNLDEAVAFYKGVMGWDFYTMPGVEDYAFVKDLPKDDPEGVNGIGIISGEMAKNFQGVNLFVTVPNIAQAEDKVRENGGAVQLSQQPIPYTGVFSITTDPEGNRLALIEMSQGH